MTHEYNELNYSKIVNDMWRFRRLTAGGNEGLQDFDVPGHFFFKILFGFDDNGDNSNGLLGLQNIDFRSTEPVYLGNSPINQRMKPNVESIRDTAGAIQEPYADTAFNFLLLNNELERANLLRQFIQLLSEINTDSPWYWKSISGLDTLLERKMFGKDFKIEEERPKISIKCLPDAYDTRIGTLLDLYRAICYSYSQKKEILPANLRKFDMSIYIFHTVVGNMHDITSPQMLSGSKVHVGSSDSELFNKSGEFSSDTYIGFASNSDMKHYTSSKLIELRNCEIDINSSKSPLGELSNEDGFGMEYTIDIYCDDAYESRYNEFVMRNIGDFIITDLMKGEVDGEIEFNATKYKGVVVSNGGETIGSLDRVQQYADAYKGYGVSEEPAKTQRPLSKIKNGVLDVATDQLSQAASDIARLGPNVIGATVGSLKNQAESFLKGKLLGNIYGFSIGGDGFRLPSAGDVRSTLSNPVETVKTAVSKAKEENATTGTAVGKPAPGVPTFEEKKAQLLSKMNKSRNIFNNI